MHFLFILLKIFAGLVTLGLFYRPAIIGLFFGWSYLFLLDHGHYNNHYYLYLLLAGMLIFMQANKWGSLDLLLFPKLKDKDQMVTAWQLWLLRFQIFVVYFYGGIAKLNPDWLSATQMKLWLPQRGHFPIFGPFLQTEFAAWFLSYSGLVLDLGIGFLLVNRKTRVFAAFLLIFFHIPNHFLWSIDTFPWFMLVSTSLFFEPDWPEKLVSSVSMLMQRKPKDSLEVSGGGVKPTLLPLKLIGPGSFKKKLILAVLGLYLCFQLLFPLRHLLYPGNPEWTGEGHLFAWRMMMLDHNEKVRVRIKIPNTGEEFNLSIMDYINQRQYYKGMSMPKQFLRFVHFIRDELQEQGGVQNPEIRLDFYRSLNGRPFQAVVDSTLNLAQVPYSGLRHADWIIPLK